MEKEIKKTLTSLINQVKGLDLETKIDFLNYTKKELSKISPFNREPIDCVLWIKNEVLTANDYNPNSVAPPEMELLYTSIAQDGYTQPIVAWESKSESYEVVDGFHRNRIGKEKEDIRERIFGYLPITVVKNERTSKSDRIASTIRHNRARGKHAVNAMSDIVIELKNRNWNNKRICKELGMDEEEVLRLCQITGLADLFKDEDFSKSWNVKDSEIENADFNDEINDEEKEKLGFRTVNTSDKNRIFHTYENWECYQTGFYDTHKDGVTKEQCEQEYVSFFSTNGEFGKALDYIINNWKKSCEHYLTNISMNRISWLGQASICYARSIPSVFKAGFNLLDEKTQDKSNKIALQYLNMWLEKNGREKVTLEEATTSKQTEIY